MKKVLRYNFGIGPGGKAGIKVFLDGGTSLKVKLYGYEHALLVHRMLLTDHDVFFDPRQQMFFSGLEQPGADDENFFEPDKG
jgi:hypothetical protein